MDKNVIYELFKEKVNEAPNATAVFDDKRSLTRKEFDMLIDTIASKIPASVRRVGIIMGHTVEMIAAVFAVLKGGRAYVPVEPFFPHERIDFMMNDANADLILTNSVYKEKISGFPCVFIDPGMEIQNVSVGQTSLPDDLAYILYTSGSTGAPKGVAVRNRNVCHYVRAFQNEFHPNERIQCFNTPSVRLTFLLKRYLHHFCRAPRLQYRLQKQKKIYIPLWILLRKTMLPKSAVFPICCLK